MAYRKLQPKPYTIQEGATPRAVDFTESASAVGQAVLVTLAEAGARFDEAKREIVIRPIKTGFGNARDGFYYTKESLRDAVSSGVFTNRKMFANHPTRDDERARPERNVWDWVSSIKEAWWDESADEPRARIKVYDDRFWTRAKQAPDEIAFSILGGGMARPGMVDGRQARIVEALTNIKSVDWVTEAGAGGGVVAFAESAHEELEMDLGNLTLEQLREARPDLADELRDELLREADEEAEDSTEEDAEGAEEAPEGGDEEAPADEADAADESDNSADDADEAEVAEADEADATEEPVAEANSVFEKRIAALEAKLAEADMREAAVGASRTGASLVEVSLRESTLPSFAKDQIKARFAEAQVGEGFTWPDDETLRKAVANEIKFVGGLVEKVSQTRRPAVSIGGDPTGEQITARESVSRMLTSMWGDESLPAKSVGSDDEVVQTETAVVADSEQPASMSEAATNTANEMEARFAEYDI